MSRPPKTAPRRAVGLLAGLCALICAAPAQGPERRGPDAMRRAMHARDVAGVYEHQGVVLGVARSYLATFAARGVDYAPALGRQAPSAHRFALRTASVRRGAAVLLRTDEHDPARSHDRTTVSYAWPTITERFATRPAGLKHSYLFAERPDGDGDLVITIAIDSTLRPDADAGSWLDEHGNGVTLGDVVAIDARGERCPGTKQLTAGGVELRLPAAFVEGARYPLEVDPLIGTAVQGYAGTDNDFPDVAYDAWSNTYCVAWTQFLGGGQSNIVGSVWLADTLALGYAFAINQPGDEDSVRVTNIAGTGLFVLIWVNYDAAGSSISGMALEPVQAMGSNVFTVDGPANVWSPVVSGEATIYDDDCLVAWLDDVYGLLGCSVTIDAQLQATATPITQIAGGNVSEPAFSKQGGAPGLHLLTWIDRPIGQPGWVRAQVVDNDMNQLGPGAWLQNNGQNCGFPAVDGDGFKFLVAWEEQEVANPSTTDVRGKIVTVGPGGITSIGGVLDLVAFPNDIDYACDVAMLGDDFGLAYMVADPTALFFDDCYARIVGPAGGLIGGELRLELTPGSGYDYEHAPRLIGRRDGDPGTSDDDGLVVFADQNITSSFDSDVGLQAIEAIGPGGAIVDLGGGCGPGGLATSPGPVALGNASLSLELYGAQPLAIPFALLGLPGARVSCGVCDFVDPTALWFAPNTAGTVITSFAIPGDPGLIGFAFDLQFASFNVLYVGCPLLPGVAASNIVRLTVDS